MIRLTPLRETDSVQALLKEEWLDVLLPMIRRQFSLSEKIQAALLHDLQTIGADQLKTLVPMLWEITSVEGLEHWIAEQSLAIQRR